MASSLLVLLPLLTLTLVSWTNAQCRVEEQYDIVLSNITKPARVLAKYRQLQTPYDCMLACCQQMKNSCNTASFLFYKGRPVCLLLECHPGHCFWGEYKEAVAAVVEDVSHRSRGPSQSTAGPNETGVTESFGTSSPATTTTNTNTTRSSDATAPASTSASSDRLSENGLHNNSTTVAMNGLTDGTNATSPLASSTSSSNTTWPTTGTSSPSTSSASTSVSKSQENSLERLFGDDESSRESSQEDGSWSSSSSSSSEEDDFVSNMLNDMYGSDSEEWYQGDTDGEDKKESEIEQEETKETAPPDTALASENDVENVPEEVGDVPEQIGGGSKQPHGNSWTRGSMRNADVLNMPALAMASAAATLIIAGIIILAIKKRSVRDRSQYRRLREEQDALVNYQDE